MIVIGHRGAKGLAPENTKMSLNAALESGVDGIEIDARTTSDNVAVLIHDKSLRISGILRDVQDLDFKTLKANDINLLTLEEALRFINHRVQVIIEIKPKTAVEPVVECLRKRLLNGWLSSQISVSSFDQKILNSIKKELPEITIIVNEAWSGVRARYYAKKLNTKYITMNQRWLWGGFVGAVARSGYFLSAYTLNDVKKARRWAKHGLHAAITDFPNKF